MRMVFEVEKIDVLSRVDKSRKGFIDTFYTTGLLTSG